MLRGLAGLGLRGAQAATVSTAVSTAANLTMTLEVLTIAFIARG